jgi:chemotaxis protein CheZ
MPIQRKVFRIEETNPIAAVHGALGNGSIPASHCSEILAELKALHTLVERRTSVDTRDPGGNPHRPALDTDAVLAKLRHVKHEIDALDGKVMGTPELSRLSRELGAVAEDAERATQLILNAAENIEDAANSLSASLKREQEQALALDIQDHVLRIFEACNFQDLGGQRIAKVLTTLKFIEERFARMAAVVGGIEAVKLSHTAASGQPSRPTALHGPKLDHDRDHVSQNDVDRLLAAG